MNDPHPPPPPTTAAAKPDGLSLHAGLLRTDWCPTCKAFTTVLCDLLLLTPQGVASIGTLRWCEICDDPDHPDDPVRRTNRA